MSRLPNFLIIGAQKSGTTSLYEYLRQHPQVYMSPIKEPHFFTYEGAHPPSPGIVTNWFAYQALFSGAKEHHIAVGEASPSYLHAEYAPERIARYLPEVRLIAILRHPAERAFANWVHNVEQGREQLDFREALAAEEDRIRRGADYAFWYKYKGFYYRHLSRYIALFPKEQIYICLFGDLHQQPWALLGDVFMFIGVNPDFQPRLERHNVSGLPVGIAGRIFSRLRKTRAVRTVVKQLVPESVRALIRSRVLVRPRLDEDIRQSLVELYREDILRLQDLLARDLSSWLQ